MWPDEEPAPGTFPRRNRLISGLSSATVVVEAGDRSGALITADWALKQGRACFLVPGPLFEPKSVGCLNWLRQFPGETKIVAGMQIGEERPGMLFDEPSPGVPSTPVRRSRSAGARTAKKR